MLHRSLKVGASPEYWLIMPLLAACGTGIVKVIGLWNFLRLGSTVTIGDTATLFPSNLATRSAGIGCAYRMCNNSCIKYNNFWISLPLDIIRYNKLFIFAFQNEKFQFLNL